MIVSSDPQGEGGGGSNGGQLILLDPYPQRISNQNFYDIQQLIVFTNTYLKTSINTYTFMKIISIYFKDLNSKEMNSTFYISTAEKKTKLVL
jgi:hypothetical protein